VSPALSAAVGAPAAVNYLPGISLFLSGVFFKKIYLTLFFRGVFL